MYVRRLYLDRSRPSLSAEYSLNRASRSSAIANRPRVALVIGLFTLETAGGGALLLFIFFIT